MIASREMAIIHDVSRDPSPSVERFRLLPLRPIASITLVAALAGCSGEGWYPGGSITRSGATMVGVEQYREGGELIDRGFEHPATVDAAALESLFRNLAYRDGVEVGAAVPSELASGLAAGIARGLAGCDGASRVRFRVDVTSRGRVGTRSPKTTRGVAFVQPGNKLNLVFDAVNLGLSEDAQPWADPTRRTIVTRKLSLPVGGEWHRDRKGRPLPMWLIVPMSNVGARPGNR